MRAALLQMTSSDQPAENAAAVEAAVAEAAAGGAAILLTPEVTNCVTTSRTHQDAVLRDEAADETLARTRAAAAAAGIWVLLGSLAVKTDDAEGRFANRSILIAPDGGIAARYDKIHMFDVAVTEAETYRESAGYRPGERAVLARALDAVWGLTICYDVRFPHLYRDLGRAGAQILTVPSAFSPATGPDHWATLLRARAVECGAWVLAPAQTGDHALSRGRPRSTYGHSLVVDPWGRITAALDTAPGLLFADIDPDASQAARARIPSLSSDRAYAAPR